MKIKKSQYPFTTLYRIATYIEYEYETGVYESCKYLDISHLPLKKQHFLKLWDWLNKLEDGDLSLDIEAKNPNNFYIWNIFKETGLVQQLEIIELLQQDKITFEAASSYFLISKIGENIVVWAQTDLEIEFL